MLRRVALTAAIALSVTTALAGDAVAPGASAPEAQAAAVRPSLTPAEEHACTGVDRAMAMVEAVGGHNFQFLDGTAARGGAEVFNATPPVSRQDWSVVALVDGPEGTGSILVGNGAEICGRVNFTSDLWPRLVERLLGRRA
jgi:hypothetical protein